MRGNRLVGYGFGGGNRRKKWTSRRGRGHNRAMETTEKRKKGFGAVEVRGASVEGKALWNKVLNGDCLEVAKGWRKATLDFVYLDPPFFTNRNHSTGNMPKGRREELSFRDRWGADGIGGNGNG